MRWNPNPLLYGFAYLRLQALPCLPAFTDIHAQKLGIDLDTNDLACGLDPECRCKVDVSRTLLQRLTKRLLFCLENLEPANLSMETPTICLQVRIESRFVYYVDRRKICYQHSILGQLALLISVEKMQGTSPHSGFPCAPGPGLCRCSVFRRSRDSLSAIPHLSGLPATLMRPDSHCFSSALGFSALPLGQLVTQQIFGYLKELFVRLSLLLLLA